MQYARFVRRLALPVQLAAALSVTIPLVAAGPAQAGASTPVAILVHGTVTASGKADAGATVYIHAWPDQNIVQALKVGQTVPWTLVGTATANASGEYSISLPVAKLVPEATSGVVNLDAGTSSSTDSFSVVIAKNAGNAYMAAADPVVDLTAAGSGDSCNMPYDSWRYL